mmetsp:Transcript_10440/g.29727  ORF Transcript_10440/g.29727 Transcript_10440/m.29727 type:complete len:105 (-) Transcript_10440:83-397(-)
MASAVDTFRALHPGIIFAICFSIVTVVGVVFLAAEVWMRTRRRRAEAERSRSCEQSPTNLRDQCVEELSAATRVEQEAAQQLDAEMTEAWEGYLASHRVAHSAV